MGGSCVAKGLSDLSYWRKLWADETTAHGIMVQGRIQSLTRRNFKRTLSATFGSLDSCRVLDFGCGNGCFLDLLPCSERVLYDPSPVFAESIAEVVKECANGLFKVRSVASVEELGEGSIDLVVMHGVVQYMSEEELDRTVGGLCRLLSRQSLGVMIAEVPHPNRYLDVLGALFAHPATVTEVLSQGRQLASTRYDFQRIQRHDAEVMKRLASRHDLWLERLSRYSFNRARRTWMLWCEVGSSPLDCKL